MGNMNNLFFNRGLRPYLNENPLVPYRLKYEPKQGAKRRNGRRLVFDIPNWIKSSENQENQAYGLNGYPFVFITIKIGKQRSVSEVIVTLLDTFRPTVDEHRFVCESPNVGHYDLAIDFDPSLIRGETAPPIIINVHDPFTVRNTHHATENPELTYITNPEGQRCRNVEIYRSPGGKFLPKHIQPTLAP